MLDALHKKCKFKCNYRKLCSIAKYMICDKITFYDINYKYNKQILYYISLCKCNVRWCHVWCVVCVIIFEVCNVRIVV